MLHDFDEDFGILTEFMQHGTSLFQITSVLCPLVALRACEAVAQTLKCVH